MAEGTRSLTDEEPDVAFEGPAIFINRRLIAIWAAGVRMAFVEERAESKQKFCSAVVLPIQDAIPLKNAQVLLFDGIEEQITTFKPPVKVGG